MANWGLSCAHIYQTTSTIPTKQHTLYERCNDLLMGANTADDLTICSFLALHKHDCLDNLQTVTYALTNNFILKIVVHTLCRGCDGTLGWGVVKAVVSISLRGCNETSNWGVLGFYCSFKTTRVICNSVWSPSFRRHPKYPLWPGFHNNFVDHISGSVAS